MSIVVVDPSKVGIMLVDAQPFLWDCMHGARELVLARIPRLLILADWRRIPLIATFEDPLATKGWLPEHLEGVFPSHGERFVKKTFNCCADGSIREAIARWKVRQVAVAGAETDVCILQSCLGLPDMQLPFLLEDCVFTSEHHAWPALERMFRAGVVLCTLKAFFYELMRTLDNEALPAKWKARPDSFSVHFQLESLPPFEPATWID